jgi:putative transferase (TIGR04331 family)
MNSAQNPYLRNCISLTQQLSDVIRASTCVRLYHEHEYFDQNQMSIWQSEFPNLNIDSGHSPMKELREQARIVLCSSIGTTYIETIHRNIPTVLFLDPQCSPLKTEHSAIFDQLERAGVLHYSPHSAAAHINDVWGKVDEWWESKSVRDAIAAFANTFSRTEKDPISFLQSVISGNSHPQRSEQ